MPRFHVPMADSCIRPIGFHYSVLSTLQCTALPYNNSGAQAAAVVEVYISFKGKEKGRKFMDRSGGGQNGVGRPFRVRNRVGVALKLFLATIRN